MTSQRRTDALVAGLGLALLLAWDATPLDLAAVRAFGNGQGFALRDHWVTAQLLHTGGKWLALGVLGLLALNALVPGGLFAKQLSRSQRGWWLLATLACAVLVPSIKQLTLTSCPWDLQEFGGMAQYVHHWRFRVPDGGGGHCFPSGHAASGFALLSGWFVLRAAYPRAARWWLVVVVLTGLLFGTAQLVRGAHYPSHTFWTAWFCWTICALMARWLPQARGGPAASSAAGPRRQGA